jgi:hypothetical protein
MKGVSFTKTRAFVFFGLAILKLFPVIDAFPLWTLDVVAVCVMTMAEDKIGVLKDLSGTFAKGGAAAATAAMTMAQKNALRRTSSVIMNRVKSINQEMPATADRKRNEKDIETRRQIANAPEQRKLLSGREQQIAAQKQQKQNAN